jgi:hypothetical protein
MRRRILLAGRAAGGIALLGLTSLARIAFPAGQQAAGRPAGARPDVPPVVTIRMENCRASRPGDIKIVVDKAGRANIIPAREEALVKRGSVAVDGETFAIYLPKAASYPIRNTGGDDTGFSNTSTLLAIDNNLDGKITQDENRYANLPLRIGDRSFRLKSIARDGSSLVLLPLEGPVQGLAVGRSCPPFSYQALDGRMVKNEDYKGRAFLIDVWSTT